MAEAGVPAKDTLQAMTLNAARLLVWMANAARSSRARRDIIAMPENPLENIQAGGRCRS